MGLKCHAGRTNQALRRLSSVPLNLRCANGIFHFLREVSHKSFVFTFSTFTFGGKSRAKPSFSSDILPVWCHDSSPATFRSMFPVYASYMVP